MGVPKAVQPEQLSPATFRQSVRVGKPPESSNPPGAFCCPLEALAKEACTMNEVAELSPNAERIWKFIAAQYAASGQEAAGYALDDLACLVALDSMAATQALNEIRGARLLGVRFQPHPDGLIVDIALSPSALDSMNASKEASK